MCCVMLRLGLSTISSISFRAISLARKQLRTKKNQYILIDLESQRSMYMTHFQNTDQLIKNWHLTNKDPYISFRQGYKFRQVDMDNFLFPDNFLIKQVLASQRMTTSSYADAFRFTEGNPPPVMFSLMLAKTNIERSTRIGGDLRRPDTHCDVTVMTSWHSDTCMHQYPPNTRCPR